MVVHQVIIDDDEERFTSLEDLNTGPGTRVGDDQVGSRDVLQSTVPGHSQSMSPPGLTSAREGLYWKVSRVRPAPAPERSAVSRAVAPV